MSQRVLILKRVSRTNRLQQCLLSPISDHTGFMVLALWQYTVERKSLLRFMWIDEGVATFYHIPVSP